jgi:hypothetical protein
MAPDLASTLDSGDGSAAGENFALVSWNLRAFSAFESSEN